MSADSIRGGVSSGTASIAAMPNKLRPIVLALFLAAAGGVLGCGGSSGPDPSIPEVRKPRWPMLTPKTPRF